MRLKILRTNPNTVLSTVAFDTQLLGKIIEFREHYNDGIVTEPTDYIRDFRVNKAGQPTFKCGMGYNIIDRDLLGGSGDGTTEKLFIRFHGDEDSELFEMLRWEGSTK